jgi:hypothetical protein
MSEETMKIIQPRYQFLIDFLQNNCTKINSGGKVFYYCPFWFVDEDGNDDLVGN